MMKKNGHKNLVAGLAISIFAPLAFASGSDAGGSAKTGDSAAYSLGKRIYATKIACDGCPMSGKKLNKAAAELLLVESGTDTTDTEKEALDFYLKRRFKL